jgi:hypothetical protein
MFMHGNNEPRPRRPKDSALASILAETSGWKAIYSDDVAAVVVRTPEPVDRVSPAAIH